MDVEDFTTTDGTLKDWHSTKWRDQGAVPMKDKVESTTEYYSLATDVLNNFDFPTPLHEMVWQLHAKGLAVKQIAEMFQKVRCSTTTIHRIIVQIQKTTGMKP